MTRDSMLDTIDMAMPRNSPTSFRRRTMATSEIKELFMAGGAEQLEKIAIRDEHAATAPSLASTSTRRMSIGTEDIRHLGTLEVERNDWEEPRLDIEGFVIDYFEYRVGKEGMMWFDAPALPYGTQPEHEMMRSMCSIFENKNCVEFEKFAEQLLASPKITFSVYQEVVQAVGSASGDSCAMSYGRLIGLVAFGGMVAAKMILNMHSDQVRNLAIYTSLFIKSRIRASWKEHKKNWAGFMQLGRSMKARYEKEGEEISRRQILARRWSIFGVSAAAVVGIVVGGRLIFGSLK